MSRRFYANRIPSPYLQREHSVPGINGLSSERRGQSIVFVADPKIVRMEKERIPTIASIEQDVLCIDERRVMVKSKSMYSSSSLNPWQDRETDRPFNPGARPSTGGKGK